MTPVTRSRILEMRVTAEKDRDQAIKDIEAIDRVLAMFPEEAPEGRFVLPAASDRSVEMARKVANR